MLKAQMCELFRVCLGMAASLLCAGDIKAMEQSCSGLLHLWPEGKSWCQPSQTSCSACACEGTISFPFFFSRTLVYILLGQCAWRIFSWFHWPCKLFVFRILLVLTALTPRILFFSLLIAVPPFFSGGWEVLGPRQTRSSLSVCVPSICQQPRTNWCCLQNSKYTL